MIRIAFISLLFLITVPVLAQTDSTKTVTPTIVPTKTAVSEVAPTPTSTKETPAVENGSKTTITVVNTPPPIVSIGDGCPIYKIKLKLKNGSSVIGYYSRSEDCSLTETFTNDMLVEEMKIKKETEATIDIVTKLNVLELPAIATSVSTNSSVASVTLTASPAKRLFFYELMNEKKIHKLDLEQVTLIEKTVNTTQTVFSDYKGSHRMVTLMKTQPFKCFITVNFSNEDCEMPDDYIIVSYNENSNEIDLRKFIESKKEIFIGNCDDTNNDKEIRKLLEPYNIAFFTENKE